MSVLNSHPWEIRPYPLFLQLLLFPGDRFKLFLSKQRCAASLFGRKEELKGKASVFAQSSVFAP